MNMTNTHKGACFCGSVEIEVSGEPEMMAYCHCESCRSWSAGTVSAFTLWQPDKVRVIKGGQLLDTFAKTPKSERQFCSKCGGHVMTNHPGMGLIDIAAATIPSLAFVPHAHVNYAETVLPIKDGLPKFRDIPSEAGGSGEQVLE
ncbi:GFA family protein [Marinobacter sp. BSs20148]|uniref:GFA family protein n=1 Tax=Marinobacter sp. BSs20148 TaxID=490759 RepID=UPI00191C633E|nr:GFA family protein [Marinobacter sp. BSs20148]